MNFFINKKNIKIISLILTFLIIFSLVSPIAIYAKREGEDETIGGTLFKPIAKLICGVGDCIIIVMQRMFLGYWDIQDENDSETYHILYSPGTIFSNKIPALNANFFGTPEKGRKVTTTYQKKDYKNVVEALKMNNATAIREWESNGTIFTTYYVKKKRLIDSYKEASKMWDVGDGNDNVSYDPYTVEKDITTELKNRTSRELTDSSSLFVVSFTSTSQTIEAAWVSEKDNCAYAVVTSESLSQTGESTTATFKVGLYKISVEGAKSVGELAGTTVTEEVQKEGDFVTSSAYVLQSIISKWYKALRLIALVGLLSVLVYVGIRIIISSTGQEKSKYKKMIMDWLAAVCILFVLQYIMAFTMAITTRLIEIFPNVVNEIGEDTLMSGLRTTIAKSGGTFWNVFGETIMYIALVILTCVFTVHYLKRLIYLAFLTMIAPLIALTYPLDKIKDGQAQAFTIWIREYVFNSLLPVIHILIYTIFVTSASELVKENPLYAVVCIGFIIPAEKFIRKMFGFDKATTTSQLGAAAGGAMVMNAINKISHAGGNGGAGGKAGKPGKTASGASGGGGDSSPTRTLERPDGGTPTADPVDNGAPRSLTGGSETESHLGGAIEGVRKKPKGRIKGIRNGISNLRKQYVNAANVRKGARAVGKGVRKGLIGAAGAAALGTFGLAAGVASGDLGKAFQYTAGAAAGGFVGANKVGDKLTTVEKKNRDLFEEGRLGTTEFKTRKAIQELQQDNDFNQECKQLGITDRKDRKRLIREFSVNGITDPELIKRAVSAGTSSDLVDSSKVGINTMIDAAKIRQMINSQKMSRKDVSELLDSRGVSGDDKEKSLNLIYSM